ncbi:hypothetical protein HHL11_06675 [Ramlibacter sp. G-1-2-2]|uniref:Uncharacterized protein n=1 Tax=Ramlibacter agri TaxID=2728837 RepID=A0A848H2R4_9BURK|nr:hypothetical protein [Ramlibacter agri]NML43430.1 hypothetical protein [Ramlibacter agri]
MNTQPQLAELQALLARHGEAVRDGDGDAVAALAEQLRQRVLALGRSRLPLREADIAQLQSMLRQCVQTQAQLARRQHDTERSLRALTAGTPQAGAAQRMYGAQGGLAAGGALRNAYFRA